MRKHVETRIQRLKQRIARREKNLMKSISRRFRVSPNFKVNYKTAAKHNLDLTKKRLRVISVAQKMRVIKLQKKIAQLFKQRKFLMGKKNMIMFEVNHAKNKKSAAKASVKAHKKHVKLQPRQSLKAKDAKKTLNKKKITLRIAAEKLTQIKAQHKILKKKDQKVKLNIKNMNKIINSITGKNTKSPSISAKIPSVAIKAAIKIKQEVLKRSENQLKTAINKLAKSEEKHNKGETMKAKAKVHKIEMKMHRRKTAVKKAIKKSLKNKTIRLAAHYNAKDKKKAMKYKSKKVIITHRVNTHRVKHALKMAKKLKAKLSTGTKPKVVVKKPKFVFKVDHKLERAVGGHFPKNNKNFFGKSKLSIKKIDKKLKVVVKKINKPKVVIKKIAAKPKIVVKKVNKPKVVIKKVEAKPLVVVKKINKPKVVIKKVEAKPLVVVKKVNKPKVVIKKVEAKPLVVVKKVNKPKVVIKKVEAKPKVSVKKVEVKSEASVKKPVVKANVKVSSKVFANSSLDKAATKVAEASNKNYKKLLRHLIED
jgi:hypothetical protein